MGSSNLPVRTQIWSWVPFVMTYLVLQRYSEGQISWQWLFFCPVSMMFWVNVHGSFILGIALPYIYFIGQALGKLFKRENAIPWRQVGWLGGIGLLSSIALLVNPRFFGIIRYAINLLSNQPIQQLIEEWQPPTPQGIANITFYLSILLFIVLIAYSNKKLNPTDLLLAVGFIWLAWDGQRSIIWYGMIVMPILARLFSGIPIRAFPFVPQKNWLNLAVAVLLFVPALIVQPWFVEKIPLPVTYWQQVLRGSTAGPLLSVHTPVEAADYLRTHPGGHLFNEMGYGSYLIWAFPEQGVFIDPRIELYPYEQWRDYIDINNGIRFNQLTDKYGVDRILLDVKLQPELASFLSEDGNWGLEYQDAY
jgi:fluoride ion exporter CrcB/FEX